MCVFGKLREDISLFLQPLLIALQTLYSGSGFFQQGKIQYRAKL